MRKTMKFVRNRAFLQQINFSQYFRSNPKIFPFHQRKKIDMVFGSVMSMIVFRTTSKLLCPLLFFITLLNIQNCALGRDDEFQKNQDALNAVTLLKRNECGNSPPVPLFKIGKNNPPAFGINACTLAILFQSCPFDTYPLICLEYFNYDVPNIGPDLLK